jgi:antitoxin ParD1/3/4
MPGVIIVPKNTNITFGSHYDEFISQLLLRGNYNNANEVVCAGLQLLEEREIKLSLLRRALVAGEESGTTDYNIKDLQTKLDQEVIR